ncbi:hypothetical protein TNCV_4450941 [Trichonephila clavipes]|nr:hypothetical protein TNCV_4450941 [Trichonephila clavipes]
MGCGPYTGSTFTTGTFAAHITCVANGTYLPTPPFGEVSCTMGLSCNGIEPGRLLSLSLSDESRFNLSSDDNRVCE